MFAGIIFKDIDNDGREFINCAISKNNTSSFFKPAGEFQNKITKSNSVRLRSIIRGETSIAISEEAKQEIYKIITNPKDNSLFKEHGDIGVFFESQPHGVKVPGILWKPQNLQGNPNGVFYLDNDISIDISLGYDPIAITKFVTLPNNQLKRMYLEHQKNEEQLFNQEMG